LEEGLLFLPSAGKKRRSTALDVKGAAPIPFHTSDKKPALALSSSPSEEDKNR